MQASSTSADPSRRRSNERPGWTIKGATRGHWWLFVQICALIVTSVLCGELELTRTDDNDVEYSVKGTKRGNQSSRQSRFIKFDNNEAGDIDLDLELKVPFLSFPLETKNDSAGVFPWPRVKLNAKALAYFAALMAVLTFVLPVLFKEIPQHQAPANIYGLHRPYHAKEHKRTDRGLDDPPSLFFGDSLNEILERNVNLGSCVDRIVCSAVATARRADEPTTSLDAIIDNLSSHRLFAEAVNGTVIKEAAEKGRRVSSAEDCATTTSKCVLNQKILLNVLKMIGL